MPLGNNGNASALNAGTQGAGNQPVGSPQAPCPLLADPMLVVKVVCNDGAVKTIHAQVAAAGAQTTGAQTGLADYGTLAPGQYDVKVTKILAPDDNDYVIGAASSVVVTLAKGEQRTVELVVDKKNVVTPKLELEYKVVLLEPELAQHQDAAEATKFVADATYIEVSISETNNAHPYTGGAKFTCVPPKADVFLDALCTQKLVGDLTNVQLPVGTTLKLYLKGIQAGKFKAKLDLIDPADAAIRIEKGVSEAMGVVNLRMELYQQNVPKIAKLSVNPDVPVMADYHTALKDLALPAQIVMSDADKVAKGALLHVQDGENFGRVKLLVRKYTKDHWPAGTDDYEIVLTETAASGGLEIHTAEWTGAPATPVKIAVKDLKAKEHELWVEGKTASAKKLDIRLDMGLDRSVAGLAKTPKLNGDWARFTVVKIDKVEVDYTVPVSGASAWNKAGKRFYINFLSGAAGRKITISAKLGQQIENVDIHFMLAPDKNNMKKANWGEDLPVAWPWHTVDAAHKHQDKTNRSDYLHLSAKTDATGLAKVELSLSRFGGDIYHPGAYLVQDPHLAKFVDGHADLEKKKPVLAADGTVTVWRKFWYQLSKPAGFAMPSVAASVAAYTAVFTELELDEEKEFDDASAPVRTFYPEHMLKEGSSVLTPVANIGNYNKIALSAMLVTKALQPVKRHLMVCLYQCDAKGTAIGKSSKIVSDIQGQLIDIEVAPDDVIVEPAMKGGSMIKSLHWYRKSDPLTKHNIAASEASIQIPRASNGTIQVKVPVIVPVPTALDCVYIVAECHKAEVYLGESFGVRHTLAVFDPAEPDDFCDTITHEFGHSFNQTPRPGTPASSIPDHPQQADRGQGNHCQVNDGLDAASGELKYRCVMYDEGPMTWGIHKFCKICHPYLLAEDFHKP
jgi:hypothetical protein